MNAKFPLFRAAHRRRRTREAWIQKIVEILQLQYTDEKVDISAEGSEDRVDAAGTFQRDAVR